jgi:hypothetical protein
MNTRLAVHFGEKMVPTRSLPEGAQGVESKRELILEDARSIREGCGAWFGLSRTLLNRWTQGSRILGLGRPNGGSWR